MPKSRVNGILSFHELECFVSGRSQDESANKNSYLKSVIKSDKTPVSNASLS